MNIYTRTGDDGTTGLIGGERVRKDCLRMRAIGEVDELNAAIGLARLALPAFNDSGLGSELAEMQNRLFDLGGELASPNEHARQHRAISLEMARLLEASMDRQAAELEPLREFILPGGSEFAARLHLARCICRRAERSIIELDAQEQVGDEAKIFINRLSDWLFTAARTANRLAGVQDVKWRKGD
jgi:cob(I)alamin adenosyltransferase